MRNLAAILALIAAPAFGQTGLTAPIATALAADPAPCADGQFGVDTDTAAALSCSWIRSRTHATDCTALTDGLAGELCCDLDDDRCWRCEPAAGDCDTAGEWKAVGGGGTPDEVADADGDTKIQVEESADDDVIRLDSLGVEAVTVDCSSGTDCVVEIKADATQSLALVSFRDSAGAVAFSFDTEADDFFLGNSANSCIYLNDTDTGLCSASNSMYFSVNGGGDYTIGENAFYATGVSNGPSMRKEAPSATNPVWTFASDADTGIGTSGADQLSLIAGATELMRLTKVTGTVEIDVGGTLRQITAFGYGGMQLKDLTAAGTDHTFAGSSFEKIDDFTTAMAEGGAISSSHADDELILADAGNYELCIAGLDFDGSATQTPRCCMFIGPAGSEVEATPCMGGRRLAASADEGSASGQCAFVPANANDRVELWCKSALNETLTWSWLAITAKWLGP